MDWIIAAAQPTAMNANQWWLAPLLGGFGAILGASLTSVVAWRVLSDAKAARRRAEEREATGVITAGLREARQIYWKGNVGTEMAPDGFDRDWTGYFSKMLGEAEVAVMVFEDEVLRQRLRASMDLLIWGAHDGQLLEETRLFLPRVVALAAHKDALACLGANLRDEDLPTPGEYWTKANSQWEWQEEQIRRAEAGE
ncbi:hypothetical protein ABZY19_39020 [Streptomyces sp. NPDC006475]|uniref:hypothetical protein n=1 Tax=Streptomyces sp. NPDC006475 TaxID=3155719 RepID=UPI0033B4D0E9